MQHRYLRLATGVAAFVASHSFSPLPAQSYHAAGNFQEGALHWTRSSFTDTRGSSGFGDAAVTTEADSEALFVSFQTLNKDMTATFLPRSR